MSKEVEALPSQRHDIDKSRKICSLKIMQYGMKITSGPLLAKCYHTQDKYLSFFKAISTDFSN